MLPGDELADFFRDEQRIGSRMRLAVAHETNKQAVALAAIAVAVDFAMLSGARVDGMLDAVRALWREQQPPSGA